MRWGYTEIDTGFSVRWGYTEIETGFSVRRVYTEIFSALRAIHLHEYTQIFGALRANHLHEYTQIFGALRARVIIAGSPDHAKWSFSFPCPYFRLLNERQRVNKM